MVHDTKTKQLLKSFRRGTGSAGVFGIAFHPEDRYVCACSDTGSVHIFDLRKTVTASWFEYGTRELHEPYVALCTTNMLQLVLNLNSLTSYVDPKGERSIAKITHPDPRGRIPGERLCCFGKAKNSIICMRLSLPRVPLSLSLTLSLSATCLILVLTTR
jgi:WD40 repeat protein